MSTRVGHFGSTAVERLQNAAFIPSKMEKDSRLVRPSEVYFASRDGNADLYKTAFTFIDFGEKANIFLRYCGVRSEPSVKGIQPNVAWLTAPDIARLLIRDPTRLLQQAGSTEK